MNPQTFRIEGFTVGGPRTFIIAEIGNNHNGDADLAHRLIDHAIDAGADCVKFQIRNHEALYRESAEASGIEDLGAEYIKDLLGRFELSISEHRELREYCKARGIIYMCTPWDEPSVDVLAGFGVPAVKIASADLVNPYLIRKAASLGKPLILSTGMSHEAEIEAAIGIIQGLDVPFVLLHCNSAYPAPERDIHLRYIKRLRALHPLIGYSGHERGTAISIAAVALGACVLERHITLDRNMEGPDHAASLEPHEFGMLVEGIRQVEEAMSWDESPRQPSQGELLNRENLAKSVIAARPISRGEILTKSALRIASPGQGLPPYRLPDLVGRKACRDLKQGDFFYSSDLVTSTSVPKNWRFPIPWGIPVRFHDFRLYRQTIAPDLFEFHLSYRDLQLDPADFLDRVDCQRLVVHAPELFEQSELLDLASGEADYRDRSIENLRRVVSMTERIRAFFPKAKNALIVANVGGFSRDAALSQQQRNELYSRFQASLELVDFGSTELIPQNMAPFPWHFGGQRHQNIFMLPQEIAKNASAMNLRVCLDLSHLRMTSTHFGIDFQSALEILLPHTAHLHIADAKGVNGEGISLGQGDIDWPAAWNCIKNYTSVSFIPEVWQGHKDHGRGFWDALDFLAAIPTEQS
jgi:N-acetylneuraminate synthase